ncbi:MAG: GNAT family N-acetyltransferase [Chlamydiota bacterium]
MFTIREVSCKGEYDELMQVVEKWEKEADSKASKSSYPERLIFEDSRNMAQGFKYTFYPFSEVRKERVFISINSSDVIQSAGIIQEKEDRLNLKFLITDPCHMRAGSGRATLEHLFQECLNGDKKGITTKAIASAVPFYQKMGFEVLDEASLRDGGPMKITAEKIRSRI